MQISCDFAPFSAAIIGFIRMNEEINYIEKCKYRLFFYMIAVSLQCFAVILCPDSRFARVGIFLYKHIRQIIND